jgi:hypothetical protein
MIFKSPEAASVLFAPKKLSPKRGRTNDQQITMDKREKRMRNFLFENNQIKIKMTFANNAKKQVKLNKLNTEGWPEGSESDPHLQAKSHKTAAMFNNKRALLKTLDKKELDFKCKENWIQQRKLKIGQ